MAVADRPANVPPQDIDAEESVLGAMLVSQNAIAIVSELLQPEDFYRRSHATIYRTILEMYGKGEVVDSITLTSALDHRGVLDDVGGKPVVHTLAATVPAAANARHYAQIVRDTATYRGLIRAGTDIASLGYEHVGEPHELVDRAEQIVFSIADQRISGDFERIDGLLKQSFERLDEIQNSDHDITGAPSGLPGPRRADGGVPEVEPGRPGRPPRHGQDVARAQHRHPPGRPRADPRRDLLARDVARGGHDPAHVHRGQGRLQAAPRRQAVEGRLEQPHRRLDPALQRADLRRRLRRRLADRDQGQGPPPEGPPRRAPRPGRRRLPPAHGRDDPGREPRPGDLADLARRSS